MTMEELVIAVRVTAENAEESLEAISDGLKAIGKTGSSSLKTAERELKSLIKQLQNTTALKKQVSAYKDLAKEVKSAGGGWEDLSGEVQAFGKRLGVAEGDLDGLIAGLESMESQTGASAAGMVSQLHGILGTLESLRANLTSIPPAELTADVSQALGAIDMLIAAINFVLNLAGEAGVSLNGGSRGGGGGGGGGGGSYNDGYSAAQAAQSAQQAQEAAFRSAVERIEHRRHLGKITAKEEIQELERVKRSYAKTADQIMEIDEMIYDARQALREAEADKITTLYDAMVEALEARYEEQRDIEHRRIEESIAAWETWSEDTCAAIQRQIDALDEQAQAEDRAAQEAEHFRKIASLEQALLYETDEYDRAQLEKQLASARKAFSQLQRDWAREDQRAALEQQMLDVQRQADEQVKALEQESERIDEVYDSLVDGQNLAAEAQKMMMAQSQKELLALLTEYAPDYEATGRSLGEKLYEGFSAAFGDISDFFEQLDTRFEEMAQRAQQTALLTSQNLQQSGQTQAAVSSPTINQTVNFYQPVESPADVARKMQQVSEELAGMV